MSSENLLDASLESRVQKLEEVLCRTLELVADHPGIDEYVSIKLWQLLTELHEGMK